MAINIEKYIKDNYDGSFREEQSSIRFKKQRVSKGAVIYPYGRTGQKMFFLNEGVVETMVVFGEVEKTLSFIFEGTFFGPFASILTREPSSLQGIAITDCEFEEFSYQDYLDTCEYSLLANKIGRLETQQYYLKKFRREKDFLTKTTEEIYHAILSDAPELIQQIPLKKIANYLGILPETLSRIRKRCALPSFFQKQP